MKTTSFAACISLTALFSPLSALASVPVETAPPIISAPNGIVVGKGLSSSTGSWTNCTGGCTYTYQWYHQGAVIRGATTASHTVVAGDLADLISVAVVATNVDGPSVPAFSALSDPAVGTTVRYVSVTDGLDTNDGTTPTPGAPHGPWKTLTKVNAQNTLPACTSVLFKRGDKWTNDGNGGFSLGAQLAPASSGTTTCAISFDAYGTGNRPIIDGSFDASLTTNWTNIGTNLWKSNQTFPPAPECNVTFSGTTVTMAGGGLCFNPPSTNQSVVFAGGTLPSPLVAGTVYYNLTANSATFSVSATPNGSAITFSGGSGTHSIAISGLPYHLQNDIGQIWYGFSVVGGTNVPPELKNATAGIKKGGTSLVWYTPGAGTAGLTSNGQWNFNTDNFTVQVYVDGGVNPAMAFTGLKLAVATMGVVINGQSHLRLQNLVIKNVGSSGFTTAGDTVNDIIFRDSVIQMIGGANNGGASDANSMIGDGSDTESTNVTGILFENNWYHQVQDTAIGPQNGTVQNDITIRNNVATDTQAFYTTFSSGTAIGAYPYNNTAFLNGGSWADTPTLQRPNGMSNVEDLYLGVLGQTKIIIRNNVFAQTRDVGINGTSWNGVAQGSPCNQYSPTGDWTDYNDWPNKQPSNTAAQIDTSGSCGLGNPSIVTWAAGRSPVLEAHSKFTDPLFTNQGAFNFAPASGSPLLNAGINLYATAPPSVLNAGGLVWDFNHNPRPATGNFTIGAFQ
jgi:hypothetical protein